MIKLGRAGLWGLTTVHKEHGKGSGIILWSRGSRPEIASGSVQIHATSYWDALYVDLHSPVVLFPLPGSEKEGGSGGVKSTKLESGKK